MNSFDIGLAFVEGLALIASPCILPVLPLVLSTSIDGGKARPFGIITGFVFAFSGFVLMSRKIVEAFHIDTDAIRYASLFLLCLLGVVLLSSKMSGIFSRLTQGAADFGSKFGAGNEGGFASGLVIGCLIGFVWTPCAGPILAAVLVQVIRQQTDVQSVLVTVAFALGAGIPMFVIALTGRKLLSRFSFFTSHTETMRKIFGVLILASALYLAFGSSLDALAPQQPDIVVAQTESADRLQDALPNPYPAPELVGIQEWLNSDPLTMASLKGKVVLVDFWTYSCINCVRTLPFVTAWDRKYRDQGLVVIGVHAPEFEFEKNVDNIKTALIRYGINYPVAVDNKLATWVNFKNQYWPAHYLIDRKGQVVYTHFGEGHYDITENNIRYLLGLKGKVEVSQAAQPSSPDQTQETYLGYARAAHFSGTPDLQHDKTAAYKMPDVLDEHHWSLGGTWKVESQKITGQGIASTLRLNFTAKKVFLVLGTADGKPQKITVKLDGQPLLNGAGKDVQDGAVTIAGHTLYELVDQEISKNHLLDIQASAPGLEAYAFTFGN